MVGIISCGTYIPKYRLSRQTIAAAMGWLNRFGSKGEKAITNFDEDSLSMAVNAGMDCIAGVDRAAIDGLYFATTTAPFKERESATIIATALDLTPQIQTADFSNSLKAGLGAAILAVNAVKAGEKKTVLACAADSRIGKPGGSQETQFGDAAAAFLIGSDGVIASYQGSYGVSYDFFDHWRAAYDKFDRMMEDRWIRDEGYNKFIGQAIAGLMKKYQKEPKDFTKVIYPCLYERDHGSIAKKLGFAPEQVQIPLLNTIGESGAASPLLSLAAALEEAKPGDNILVASWGNGSEAAWFQVTPEIEKKRNDWFTRYTKDTKQISNYEQYLAFKGILNVEVGMRGEVANTLMPVAWRDRRQILGLVGSKCKKCGTPQYPPQRICVNPDCHAIDEMEAYRFADKKGTLFSFTEDHLAASFNPPVIHGAMDFEGGGRHLVEFTDCESGTVSVGMPVKMTFRRKYVDELRGITMYCWKAIPLKEQGGK